MYYIKQFFRALFISLAAILATIFVIAGAFWSIVVKPKRPIITYRTKNGKVVDINDFRADKAGREL